MTRKQMVYLNDNGWEQRKMRDGRFGWYHPRAKQLYLGDMALLIQQSMGHENQSKSPQGE